MAYEPLRRGAGALFDFNLNRMLKELYAGMDITQAENVVLSTYGDRVSVEQKAKNLNKFGTNTTVGTSFETVAQFQGTTANETYVSTNLIDSISSSDQTNDVGITFVVEGHTIDGSGNLTFVSQEVTLDGTDARTKVSLPTPMARANRAYVKASGTFNSPQAVPTGTIYIYDDTGGVTNGVPTDATGTKLLIEAGETQTQKCATSISSTDYWFIDAIDAGVGSAGGSANRVLIRLETRDVANGGVWRPLGRELTLDVDQGGVQQDTRPFLIVPKNHDMRVRALTNANTASVFAEVRGYLAKVVA